MKIEYLCRPTESRISRGRLERVARRVRAAAVNELVRKDLPDPSPTRARGRFYCPKDLRNACAIVSFALMKVLHAESAPAVFVLGEYATKFFEGKLTRTLRSCVHCWVEIGGTVIDLTATQFGEEAIVIFQREDPRYRAYHEIHATGTDALGFINRKWWSSPKRAKEAVRRIIAEAC